MEEKAVIGSMAPHVNSDVKVGDVVIEVDPRYFRPTEVNHLQADITKARTQLKWEPRFNFLELVKVIVDYDLKAAGIEPANKGTNACRSKGFCYTDHAYSFYEKVREGA